MERNSAFEIVVSVQLFDTILNKVKELEIVCSEIPRKYCVNFEIFKIG